MARMLAQHCELVSRDDAADRACASAGKRHVSLTSPYQEKLKSALQKHFGAGLQVSIRVGESNGNSPAEIAEREHERSQARAIAEIEQDPFVRELVENFDARVNSIKPLQ